MNWGWRVLRCLTENTYTWMVSKNIFNNQLQTAERGWLLTTHHQLEAFTKCYRRPQNGQHYHMEKINSYKTLI
jgi:hypothetical protein